MENVPNFTKNSVKGEELVEPKFWEISDSLPSIILDILLEKKLRKLSLLNLNLKLVPHKKNTYK